MESNHGQFGIPSAFSYCPSETPQQGSSNADAQDLGDLPFHEWTFGKGEEFKEVYMKAKRNHTIRFSFYVNKPEAPAEPDS